MMRKLVVVVGLVFFFFTTAFAADLNSPVGRWITISDKTHDRSGVVELFDRGGKVYGKVIKIFPGSGRDPAERCVKCEGNFKDKPVVGLTFLWGMMPQGNGRWGGGQLLDPHTGEIYRGTMTLIDGGRQLQLRGYWGIFWRTQTWVRAN